MTLPLIVEPKELEQHLYDDNIVIVDLCKRETFIQGHIPQAVHLEYPLILKMEKPVMGLLPDKETLCDILGRLGITRESHVVCYDDEGGGKASRLLWTLDVLGHEHSSLLNGGLQAWANEGHGLTTETLSIKPASYDCTGTLNEQFLADKDYVYSHLNKDNVKLLDTRSLEEFNGTKKFAAFAGHIPGAINLDWMNTMDKDHNLRFLPDGTLRAMLDELDITPDDEIILYCQTHHRSSHTYIMLKHLGYENIKGYPGAWSEWGNLEDTPKEV